MPRTKRPAGSGHVVWRDGAWRIQVHAAGRRINRSHPAPHTATGRREAERLAMAIYDETSRRRHEAGTFGALLERYIAFKAPDWPPGAIQNTRYRLNRHLPPTLLARPLTDVGPMELDDLYTTMRSSVTPATIARVHNILRAALNQAVKWGMVDVNPAKRATPPKVRRPTKSDVPDPATIRKLIDRADPWMAVLLRLAVHTGARRGELVRLRWSDFVLDGSAVTIYQSKTDRTKVLALGPDTVDALETWHKVVIDQYEAVRGWMPGDWWVFPSVRRWGEHVTPGAVTHAWERLRHDAGLPGLRFHDLRGTMATTLLTRHHDPSTVRGRGGWTDEKTMYGAYARFVSPADQAAAYDLDRWLQGDE